LEQIPEIFRLSAPQALSLSQEFGTPLYVMDQLSVIHRCRAYKAAAKQYFPEFELSYASKANSACGLLTLVHSEGFHIDCASEGEIRAALRSGVRAEHCRFHGNGKSRLDLEFALKQGIGQIIVDSLDELALLRELRESIGETRIVLRLAPGIEPGTHAHISTGQQDTKFGFGIEPGFAIEATRIALENKLPLIGFHFHMGSQLMSSSITAQAASVMAEFAVEAKNKLGFCAELLNFGGGLGARYTDSDTVTSIFEHCRLLSASALPILRSGGLKPRIALEPGRSLVAEAGVTLYRVMAVKTIAIGTGTKRYVTVDGGMSDNVRPALYGAKYTVKNLTRGGHEHTVTVCGRHCETDELFPNVELPSETAVGDILEVLTTGAYGASMASNYNRFLRPAMVAISGSGDHTLWQRRESWEELFSREVAP
jgi:diaminopimelate decarboxylase